MVSLVAPICALFMVSFGTCMRLRTACSAHRLGVPACPHVLANNRVPQHPCGTLCNLHTCPDPPWLCPALLTNTFGNGISGMAQGVLQTHILSILFSPTHTCSLHITHRQSPLVQLTNGISGTAQGVLRGCGWQRLLMVYNISECTRVLCTRFSVNAVSVARMMHVIRKCDWDW